jgi:hypothetical protein
LLGCDRGWSATVATAFAKCREGARAGHLSGGEKCFPLYIRQKLKVLG